ncbi:MAG: sugar ABC transporter permease [Candidatus Bipolaricaulota bacterium]|nr:sugar ABC transporter permease [Candidatus Bipolaricaulota bacterium]
MHLTRDRIIAFSVLLPSLILIAVFVYGFIGQTVYISLTDWGKGAALAVNPEMHLIGFDNYKELFTSFLHGRFRQDLVNAFFYTMTLVLGSLTLGLFLAILLDREPRGEGMFRTIFLYPMSLSFVVTGTIWRWLLTPGGGINVLPTFVGLPAGNFRWISSRGQILTFDWQSIPVITAIVVALVLVFLAIRTWRRGAYRHALIIALPAVLLVLWALFGQRMIPQMLPIPEKHGFNLATIGISIAAIWQFSGYTMALYLAGLRGIPVALHEAARLDGASDIQYYMRVAFPILKPITLSAVIILAHISLKMFALIFAMAGPDNASTGHPAVLMYLTTFRGNKFALGASIAVILFLLVALFIIPYLVSSFREQRRRAS